MSKKLWIFGIVMLLLTVGFATVQTQFTIYEKPVYIPTQASGECVPRADNMEVIDMGEVSNTGEFVECNSQETGKYVPKYPGIECRYNVDPGYTYSFYSCTADAEVGEVQDKCEEVKGSNVWLGDQEVKRFTVDAGRKAWINAKSFLGTGIGGATTLKAEYPSYGLKVETAFGQKFPTTQNCAIQSLGEDYHVTRANQSFVKPDNPVNVISGKVKAESNRVVTLEGVNGGEPVYISSPGHYRKVKTAQDGFKYVDMKRSYTSSEIECIPGMGCTADAKKSSISGQECTAGEIQGYAPVQGDEGKMCKYECVNGELARTNDCVEIPDKCEEGEVYSATKGECVSNQDLEEEEDQGVNWQLLFIIFGGAMFIIIAMLVVKQVMEG